WVAEFNQNGWPTWCGIRSLKAGFFRYLTKPIKIDEFMDTLGVALNYAKDEAALNSKKQE
ncbi:MAG: hypothetical protein ACOYL3_20310, partial [Desulfuromonadaceae bacterium]